MDSVRKRSKPFRNFHLPLPPELSDRLEREAARSGRPATAVAREALASWLRTRERTALSREIAADAEETAGTTADWDEDMEVAATDQRLLKEASG